MSIVERRTPQSVEELCGIVRHASARGLAVYPVGGGLAQGWGHAATKPGIAVTLTALNRVLAYPARDMTIQVEAGITLDSLATTLAAENQYLPIDVPRPATATLGGAVAVNASGSRRYGAGTLRDYVIGIRYVNDRGEQVKAGGNVVKNVAGYDVMKLLTGSFGTLGIVSGLTLKLKPRPEGSRWVLVPLKSAGVGGYLETLRSTRTRPMVHDLFTGSLLGIEADILGVVAFEDNAASVAWQVEQLARELGDVRPHVCTDGEAATVAETLRDFPMEPPLTFKANMVPAGVAAFVTQATGFGTPMRVHAGNGIVHGGWTDRAHVDALRRTAETQQGGLVIPRGPAGDDMLPVWGSPRGEWKLMRAVKTALDPANVFNPGRFVERI